MNPTDRITFHFLDKFKIRTSIETLACNFKEQAIYLLEQETNDVVSDVYYTINGITTKLDYYNAEL